MTEKEEKIEVELEKTRRLSIKEGAAASVMSGFGDSNISLYAMQLNANNFQMGFLSSFTGFLSPLSQILGSRLMERYTRRKLIIAFVSLQALMWFPIMVLGLLYFKGYYPELMPSLLIGLYALYAVFGALGGPSWFSLMGDIVPEKIRGKYFSKRNKICGIIALISTLIAAFFLDVAETKGFILLGFSIIFSLAGIFRLISAGIFRKHYYPELKLEKGYYFSFFSFIKKSVKNNFGRFTIYVALMHFATAVAGPFFAVYMRRDLEFNVLIFTIANISASVFTLLFLPLVGKISDKYGNRELLRVGSLLIPLIPILWLFSSSPLYLILVPQLISGIGWAAFNFASSNFIYDSVTPQRRGICVSYFNLTVGIFVFFGSIIGGFLAQHLEIKFMNPLLFIFLLSGILRFGALFMLPIVKEVREVHKPRLNPMLYLKEIELGRESLYFLHKFLGIGHLFNLVKIKKKK